MNRLTLSCLLFIPALYEAIGEPVWKKLKEELKHKLGAADLSRFEMTEYATQYAKQSGIITEETQSQRLNKLKKNTSRRTGQRGEGTESPTDDDFDHTHDDFDTAASVSPSAASTSKKGSAKTKKKANDATTIVVMPWEGEGAGISITIRRSLDELKRHYAEGKSMAKVFGDAVATQVRVKRSGMSLGTSRHDIRRHLENLAVVLGIATSEELKERESRNIANRSAGKSASYEGMQSQMLQAHRRYLIEKMTAEAHREQDEGVTTQGGNMRQELSALPHAPHLMGWNPSMAAMEENVAHATDATYPPLPSLHRTLPEQVFSSAPLHAYRPYVNSDSDQMGYRDYNGDDDFPLHILNSLPSQQNQYDPNGWQPHPNSFKPQM
jgi:hypothetical protein